MIILMEHNYDLIIMIIIIGHTKLAFDIRAIDDLYWKIAYFKLKLFYFHTSCWDKYGNVQ